MSRRRFLLIVLPVLLLAAGVALWLARPRKTALTVEVTGTKGLAVEGTYWAQFAYQFGHEFCHALAGHCNDWKLCWRELGQSRTGTTGVIPGKTAR